MMRTLLAAALLAGASTTPWSVAHAQISNSQGSVFNPTGGDSRWEKTVPVIASGEWTGPRLADGQPDVSGNWSNTISNHGNFTDPQAGDPGEPTRQASLPRDQRAPSRVSDPADGQIPYLPAARALQQDFERNSPSRAMPGRSSRSPAVRPAGRAQVVHVARLRNPPISRAWCCCCSIRARASSILDDAGAPRRTRSSCGTAIRTAIGKATRWWSR
jgi:hypothetical protein